MTKTVEYALVFACCDAEVPLGSTPTTGHHDQYCLVCDTADPDTEIIKR